ncbi:MAG: D-sedoheptulose 7-phosphate isomerase [Bacteroidales bacterium]|nr:D-sedoheptulose 7-phosphate isomerase [Bacteroidales bacterium]
MQRFIRDNLQEAREVLDRFLEDPVSVKAIADAADLMITAIRTGNKIISCGNGGSMSDAMHFAEELSGRYREDRRALPAISISDPSHITCTANDYGFERIFSRFVEGVGSQGDVLLAISTSGNSMNVVHAAGTAREKGMKVVALTGKTGGMLSERADVEIRVQGGNYSDRIQEIHIKVIHILIGLIEKGV